MPNEQDQQVTVRLLPDGDTYPAHIGDLSGYLLRISLSPVPAEISLNAGDLVEVTCPKTLYLGEVRSRQGETMIVGIEHSLDRETLALIQQVWHGPPGR
jgi:hypothetical protein